jgi:hypothetical protein
MSQSKSGHEQGFGEAPWLEGEVSGPAAPAPLDREFLITVIQKLVGAINAMRAAFPDLGDEAPLTPIQSALGQVEEIVAELERVIRWPGRARGGAGSPKRPQYAYENGHAWIPYEMGDDLAECGFCHSHHTVMQAERPRAPSSEAIEAAAKIRWERTESDSSPTKLWADAPSWIQKAFRETAALELRAAYAIDCGALQGAPNEETKRDG